MRSQTRKEIVTIQILVNISRSRGNQTESLISWWKTSCIKYGGEASPIPFSKIAQNSEPPKILYNLLVLYVQVESNWNILKLRCWQLALASYKALSKKKRSGTHFSAVLPDSSKKLITTLCCINWPYFIVWLPLHLDILANMRIVITYFSVYNVMIK